MASTRPVWGSMATSAPWTFGGWRRRRRWTPSTSICLDIDHIARIEDLGCRFDVAAIVTIDIQAKGPFHVVSKNRSCRALGRDRAAGFPARTQTDINGIICCGQDHCNRPFGHVTQGLDFGELRAPVCVHIELRYRTAETTAFIIVDQALVQCLARQCLKLRIKRGADRQSALVQRVIAVAVDHFAAHFLGEILRSEKIGPTAARNDVERLGLGLSAVLKADIAVLDHTVDHPVAALDRAFGVPERMIIVRRLGKGRKIGGLRDGQLIDRFVEIGERGSGDAVGIEAEENLVEIKLQNPVLGIGLLDAEGEDRLLDLALIGLIGREQEVLCDLLGNRGCALTDAPVRMLVITARARPTGSTPG
jgi:hypothetical protein